MSDNMTLYNKARVVPQEAKKPITAGRLKGFTDINPMWRIKRMTEMFGPCGIGWWYKVTDKTIARDEGTKQAAAFVDIELYYVDPESGAISQPIYGTGGSSFVAMEKNGLYMSDECFKMALTDAISVAAKSLGIGADVYFDKDRSKYTSLESPDNEPPEKKPDSPPKILCERCGKEIERYTDENGKGVSPAKWAANSKEKFGKALCLECISAVKAGL